MKIFQLDLRQNSAITVSKILAAGYEREFSERGRLEIRLSDQCGFNDYRKEINQQYR